MSVEKRFRRCVDPCQRFLTPDETHDLCVMCLGKEHARSVLEGMECVHCELFSLGKLRSRMSLFSSELGQSSAPPRLFLDRVLLGFLSFKRVILLKPPLSRALLRPHYWCVSSIVSLVSFL